MGQQQLLLLVLGIIIVAIASMVGIQAFNDGRRKSAGDDLVTVSSRIAAEGTAWVLRHPTFGGGGDSPSGITFAEIGYTPEVDGTYLAGGGVYTITSDAGSFTISGVESTYGMYVVTRVWGPTSNCMVTISRAGSAPTTPTAPGACTGW